MTTPNPTCNTTASPEGTNVHSLKPGTRMVQPPDGWVLEGQFGHMAFEAGEGGRLVRLADVLRWLQSSREIPRSEALQVLCDGMPAEVMDWLYWLQPTARATPVPATHTFGFATAEQIAARKEKDRRDALQKGLELERSYGRFGVPTSMQNGRVSSGYPSPTDPGLPALVKYLRGWWVLAKRRRLSTCDVLDDPALPEATRLAVRLDKAHALWGYGRTVAAAVTKNLEDADPPAGWVDQSPLGMLRRGPLPADRLVRLVDVVRWFITERGTPRISALQRVCDVIDADAMGWLYRVTEGTYAVPADPGSGFAQFLPGTGTNAEKLALSFVSQMTAVWGNAHEPNSVLDADEQPCAALACTINQAHALWGYGTLVARATAVADIAPATVKTYADLIEHRKVNKGAPWLSAHVDLMAGEIDLRTQQGQKGVRSGIGKELGGISPARISELLKKERKRQPARTSTQQPDREAA